VPEGGDVEVSLRTRFLTAGPTNPDGGPESANGLWQQFVDTGKLTRRLIVKHFLSQL
jgi:hypothetical protein